MNVWVREFDQRCSNGIEYAVYTQGPYKAKFVRRTMSDNTETTSTFKGETAFQAAERAFTEEVIKAVHG